MPSRKPKETEKSRIKKKPEGQLHEVLVLSRISAALSGLWDLDAILGVGLDSTLDIMNGTIGEILIIDEQTQTLSHRVHRGLSEEFIEQLLLSLGEGINGRVAQTGKAIMLEDISSDPRVAHPELVRAEGLKAFVCVPLRAKEKVLGVLNVASRIQRDYTSNDMHLLYAIGDQLGIAIEQARLYERLRIARERYRRLARQTLVAQDDERKRLARELHDETSQTLSGLTLQLQALVDITENSNPRDTELIASLKKVQSLTTQVHSEVSRIIRDLRPSLLDTLGLIPAIRQYAETNLHPLSINVSVEMRGMDRRLPPEVETGLFRVIQGAVGNIIQHSKAKNASIILEYQGGELSLSIIDDGVGFDVSKITDIEESGRGRGLFSMRERVMLLGGTGWVESEPGKGTKCRARIPGLWEEKDAANSSDGSR